MRRIAVIAALTALGISVPSASAGQSEEISTERGSVVFLANGERLLAHDEKRDGYGVRAVLTWNDEFGGHTASVTDGSSSGGPARRNLSFPERKTVWLQLCYTKNGAQGKCSLTQRAVA